MKSWCTISIRAAICIALIFSCSDRERSNPLDPGGPAKSGDVFGLHAEQGINLISLSWTDYSFDDFEHYKVYRSADSTGTYSVIGRPEANAYSDSLSSGYDSRFFYRVSMVANGEESELSNRVSASPLDGTPPSVAFLSPSENESIAGEYEIKAEGSDNHRFSHIHLFIDSMYVAADSTAPYGFLVVTADLNEGEHVFTATAWDVQGNTSSVDRTVTVTNTPPAVESITADDPDGYVSQGELAFTITFNQPMNTEIKPSVTFGNNQPYDAHTVTGGWQEDSSEWKGTCYIDQNVEEGTHILAVRGAQSKASVSCPDYSAFDFIVDYTKPVAGQIVIESGDPAVNTYAVNVSCSVSDENGSGATEMRIANRSDFNDVSWTEVADTIEWNLSPGDGVKNVYVQFRDKAGNLSEIISDSIIMDVTAPSLTMVSPLDNAVVVGMVPVEVSASDNTGIARITLLADNVILAEADSSRLLFEWDTSAYSFGNHTLTARATDYAENTAEEKEITVEVQSSGPQVTVVETDPESPVNNGLATFTVSFDTDMKTSVPPTVTFGSSTPYTTHTVNGSWKSGSTWEGTVVIDESTGDGEHYLKITGATSVHNITMDDNTAHSFIVDTTAPIIDALTLGSGGAYASSPTVTLSIDATDENGNIPQLMISQNAAFNGASWQNFESMPSYLLSGGDGEKTLYCKVRDAAGNASSVRTTTFILDSTPPSITLINPADGSIVSGSIPVSVEITDDNGIIDAVVILDGNEVRTLSSPPYVYSLDTTQFADDSQHTLAIRARDNAGNSVESNTVNITVNQNIPTVSIFSITKQTPWTVGTYTITITFSLEMNTNEAIVASMGTIAPFDALQIAGSWADAITWEGSVDIGSGFTNGSYSIAVDGGEGTDGSPMARYVSNRIVIDTTPPQSPSLTINSGDAYTTSQSVNLALNAVDTTSAVAEMLISNSSQFADAEWEPYASEKTWRIGDAEGPITVYVKYRDAAGNESAIVSDTITANYESPSPVTLQTTGETGQEIMFLWSENADSDFAAYELKRSDSPGVSSTSSLIGRIEEQGTVSFTDNSVIPGETYYYRVFVQDVAGQFTGSNEISVTVPNPQGVKGTVTDRTGGDALANVSVTISPNIAPVTQTTADGTYYLEIPDPGEYTLTFEKNGFISVTYTFTLSEDETLTQDVSMLTTPQATTLVNPGTVSLANPQHIALSSDGLRGYVTDADNDIVAVLDTGTGSMTGSIEVGDTPLGVATSPVFNQVFVANSKSNTISIIDGTNNQELRRVTVGTSPQSLAVTPDGDHVLVTNKADNTVSVVEISTGTVTGTVNVGSDPLGIAVLPDGSAAYVANSTANSVSIIDLGTLAVSKTIFVSSGPGEVVVDREGAYAYVANRFANSVSVINTETQTAERAIPVGEYPTGLAVSAGSDYEGYLMVLNYSGSNMMLVDLETYEPSTETVSLGNFPTSVAVEPDGGRMYVLHDINANVMVIEW